MTERDSLEVDALVTDGYIDDLLAGRERRTPAERTAGAPEPERVDAAVRTAVDALERRVVRVHPSFRFEERLAADLQGAGARHRRDSRARPAAIRRLDQRSRTLGHTLGHSDAPVPGPRSARSGRPVPAARPLLIGGALTSAALSLAGAWMAWRRGRPPMDPMVRAVRAAHRSGLARRIPAGAARLGAGRQGD